MDIFDLDRFHTLEQLFVNHVSDPLFYENGILFLWLIQSHAQGRPGSAALGEEDPDGRDLLPVLECFLDHATGFFRYLKHGFPPLQIRFYQKPLWSENIITKLVRQR